MSKKNSIWLIGLIVVALIFIAQLILRESLIGQLENQSQTGDITPTQTQILEETQETVAENNTQSPPSDTNLEGEQNLNCAPPYSVNSPWNQKIPINAPSHPNSSLFITALEGVFGSNPYSWTQTVYEIGDHTPLVEVRLTNRYRNVVEQDGELVINYGERNSTIEIPIPEGARPSDREDAQLIVLNQATGDEWGLYQARKTDQGWEATGAYHYNTNWTGVTPEGFGGRGGGSPYLAGLIRKCEIEQGYIAHVLVMGYDYPCSPEICEASGYSHFVYPATRGDGEGQYRGDMPEGARLQLDPGASEADINQWCGDDRTCRVIVRAMQEYGIYVMESSDHPKIYPEDDFTAEWGDLLDERTISNIPYTAFRVLDWNQYSDSSRGFLRFP